MPIGATDRIASLDFIRGIAVLGILASNIVTYARPNEARRVVALVHEVTFTEWFPWLVNYIFIDGKFRAMFAALFGVGLVVFMERARARGAPARWLPPASTSTPASARSSNDCAATSAAHRWPWTAWRSPPQDKCAIA